ncbi:MAG: ABC transporter permease [Vicinamibacteria bacterium]
MFRLIIVRLAWGLATLWVVSIFIFAGTELLSGDAATAVLGKNATPEALAAIREQLGLDRSPPERYVDWLLGVLQGDLGNSLSLGTGGTTEGRGGVPVADVIESRLVNSGILTGIAALVTIPLAIILGVLSAVKVGRLTDSFISNVTLGLIALPEFVTGSALILLFAIFWPLLPAVSFVVEGQDFGARAAALALPVATLGAASIAHTSRMVRGSMIEALDSEYVQMARLKGVPERFIVARHALRNALGPTIQVIALTLAWLVGGIVVVEVVFEYPGVGQALANAVSARDLPVVQALALLIAGVYVIVNLTADLASILLTPKLRESA